MHLHMHPDMLPSQGTFVNVQGTWPGTGGNLDTRASVQSGSIELCNNMAMSKGGKYIGGGRPVLGVYIMLLRTSGCTFQSLQVT